MAQYESCLGGFLKGRKLELSLEGFIRIVQKERNGIPGVENRTDKGRRLKTAWNMGISYIDNLLPFNRVQSE